MLTVTISQMDAFRHARLRDFVRDMTDYIAAEYPRHHVRLGADGVRAFVERSMESARRLGITREGAVGALTELRLVYGDDLERAPDRQWARNILAHGELPDYIKVEAVQNRLQEKTDGFALVVFDGAE